MNLISILIGLAISALLLASATQWLMLTKKTFQLHRNEVIFLDVNQNALQYFLRDIQAGGYRGRRSADPSFPLYRTYSQWNEDLDYFHFDRTVFGFLAHPGVCYKKMPVSACKRIKENSPVLIIYNVAQKINPLSKAMKHKDEPLTVPLNHGIHNHALVLISDGQQGDLFIATRLQDSTIFHDGILRVNQSSSLSKAYSEQAEVVELQTVAYYLGIPERFEKKKLNADNHSDNKAIYALFRDDFLQKAQEIIAGVSHVDFEYALQSPMSAVIRYQKPDDIPEKDWGLVRGLRITLTLENAKTCSFEIAIRNRVSSYFNIGFINPYLLAWDPYGNAKLAYLSKNQSFFFGT